MIPAALTAVGAAADGRGGLSGPASVSAIVLAAVFVVTAVAKLTAPLTTADQFRQLQLPLPSLLAGAVPAAELLVAAALVLAPRVGGEMAVGLLAGFTAVIVRTVRRGLRVSCGCLGSIERRPVSWDAVVRNTALAMLAVVASTTASLRRPDLPSLLAVAGFGLSAVVTMHLVALREDLGRIWSVRLAGELTGGELTGGLPVTEPGPGGPEGRA